MKKERAWDNYLQIHTTGRDDARADQYHHPYEPTPYAVLERLADSGFFREGDTVVDYGCGKGRVGFLLGCKTGAKTVVPGLTGLAQISGRDVLAAQVEKKAKLDGEYVEKRGIWFDLKIFLLT